jgi:hypothetical protein
METNAALLPTLEDAWTHLARSRAGKGRSVHTLNIWRNSYERLWRWAETEGLPADPGAVSHRHVNVGRRRCWPAPLVRNGKVTFDVNPDTGKRVPGPIRPKRSARGGSACGREEPSIPTRPSTGKPGGFGHGAPVRSIIGDR